MYYFTLPCSIYYIIDTLTVDLKIVHKWHGVVEHQLTLTTSAEYWLKSERCLLHVKQLQMHHEKLVFGSVSRLIFGGYPLINRVAELISADHYCSKGFILFKAGTNSVLMSTKQRCFRENQRWFRAIQCQFFVDLKSVFHHWTAFNLSETALILSYVTQNMKIW